MTLDDLLEEYKTLPPQCENINYADPASIARNNKAVKRMHKIVETVNKQFRQDGIKKLSALLSVTDNGLNIWLATQLLEKVDMEEPLENRAINIIKQAARGDDLLAAGYRQWLENFKSRWGM